MRTLTELEIITHEFLKKSNAIISYVGDRERDYFYTLFLDENWRDFCNSLIHEEILLLVKSKVFRARLLVAEYPKNYDVLELLLSDPEEKVRKVAREVSMLSEAEKKIKFKINSERY